MQKNNFIIFRGHPLFLIRQLIFRRFLTELFAAKLCEYELNYKFTFKMNTSLTKYYIHTLCHEGGWYRKVQKGLEWPKEFFSAHFSACTLIPVSNARKNATHGCYALFATLYNRGHTTYVIF